MQQTGPKVTAILPSYNAAKFIHATLDSLAAQTWPNLEILIGDDCSTDNTPDILRAFVAKQPNARLIIREKNLGWDPSAGRIHVFRFSRRHRCANLC